MRYEEQQERAWQAKLWWQSLQGSPPDTPAGERRPTNNAALARLRRAEAPIDAMMEPEAILLMQKIGGKYQTDRLLVVELAALLSHIRADEKTHFAASLGGHDADSRIMKPARFHRLIQSASVDRAVALRRAIKMLKGSANVKDIAYAWLVWDSKVLGESMRIDWMFHYVGASDKDIPNTTDSYENPQVVTPT